MSSAALALGLAGCNPRTYPLTVYLLEGAVPPTLLNDFSRQAGTVQFKNESQLSALFDELQRMGSSTTKPSSSGDPIKNTPATTSLVSLGDYWLTAAIQADLIRPLSVETVPGWSRLPQQWQRLVTRNASGYLDDDGKVWGAPYRMGSLVIAYRRAELAAHGGPPQDWRDLWRPELGGKISMLDSARTVIGVALKALGADPNAAELGNIAGLTAKLTALHQQVKLYSSEAYLQPLLLDDVWLAVGWSTDILPLVRRNPRLAVMVPQSGTLTTSDIWVQPSAATAVDGLDLAAQWISFLWQPEIATRLSLLNTGVSPLLLNQARGNLPSALQTDAVLLPKKEVIDRSAAILPLPPSVAEAYSTLWVETRQTVSTTARQNSNGPRGA